MTEKQIKPKASGSRRLNRDMTTANIIMTVLTVLINVLVVYIMMNTTRFASLSKKTFILVNIVILLILLAMNWVVMRSIQTRRKNLYIASIVCLCVGLVIGSYGTFAISKVNSNMNRITGTTEESVSTSLVVYNGDGTSITDVSQLDGKSVGYALGTKTAELGKNQIDGKGVMVTYDEYQDYSSVLLALFNNEVQCAILPTNYMNMFQNEAALTELLADTSSILDFTDKVKVESTAGSDKDITTEPFTVLLIGNADGLSDTMILCSVNPISMRVTMSSIPRDSWVPISCYNGGESKLNAAHASGVDCLIKTIERLIGVKIDYYVDTNFRGVVEVVDALGGITVNSPVEFVGQNSDANRGSYTVWVPAGENVPMNGEQALAFARERHLFAMGDFARQVHQQEVIEAIMRKIMRTRDVNTFLKVLDAAGNNIQTNFTVSQMTDFVSYLMKKTNRYYDTEHVEKVLQMETSRVTGYNSGIWNEGMQLTLSIVRLWDGSIADTRKAIERNIDMTSSITSTSGIQWSTNWLFEAPTISADVYNEVMIPADVPTTVGNFVGRTIGVLQSWAGANGITVYATPVQDASQKDGTILTQDVSPDAQIGDVTEITVTYVDNSASQPTATPDLTTEEGCKADNKYWYDGACHDSAKPAAPDLSSESGCNLAGKYWYDGACHDTAKPAAPDLSTESGCNLAGKYWYDGACHDSPAPDLSTESGCNLAGKYWYDDACHDSAKPATPTPAPTGDATQNPTSDQTDGNG